jgi:hypothetical protein
VQLHEGPCITAVDAPPDDGVVVAQDLGRPPDADRAGHASPRRAVAHRYQSLLSTQLSTNGGTRAALNLYARTAHTFDEPARTTAGLWKTDWGHRSGRGGGAATAVYGLLHEIMSAVACSTVGHAVCGCAIG